MLVPLPKRPAAMMALLVLVAISLVATACGGTADTAKDKETFGGGSTAAGDSITALAPAPTTGETTAASEPDATSTSTSADSGLFFPKHVAGATPSSVGNGELIADHAGCIRLDAGPYSTADTIIWSPDYALETEDGEALILDGEGRVVARIGDQLAIGGGGMNGLEGVSGVDERTRRELHERCPGSYFYGGEVVRAQQR